MDRPPLLAESDFILNTHGTEIMIPLGVVCLVLGYFGGHWLNRRRFYRAKAGGDHFATYSQAWRAQKLESNSGCLFGGLKLAGLLFIAVGLIDWVDG